MDLLPRALLFRRLSLGPRASEGILTGHKVTYDQIQRAIARGQRDFPNEWQAEELEIALIPAVNTSIKQANNQPFNLKRVSNKKFGKGYVLENWNGLSEDHFAHSPSTAANGVGRNFYGHRALNELRMWGYGHSHKGKLELKLEPRKGQTVAVLEE